MEAFYESLMALIDQADGSPAEILGFLEIAKASLLLDLTSDDEDAEA